MLEITQKGLRSRVVGTWVLGKLVWHWYNTQLSSREKTHHGRDSEISGMHLLCEPINLPPGVDEDHCLGNGQGFIQVTQCVQLPLL